MFLIEKGGKPKRLPAATFQTEDEFQRKLKETGLTVDDLKSEIRRQLSIEKLLNRIAPETGGEK